MGGILACVDFSDMTVPVLDRAVSLALGSNIPVKRIHLLHVAAPEPEFVGFDTDPATNWTRDHRSRELLDERRVITELAHSRSTPELEVHPLIVMGPTVDKILDEISRLEAELVVVGSHGHGALYNLFMGSVAADLTKRSPIPVDVVPHPARVALA